MFFSIVYIVPFYLFYKILIIIIFQNVINQQDFKAIFNVLTVSFDICLD